LSHSSALAAKLQELVADGKLNNDHADHWLAELKKDAAAGTLTAGVCGSS
jgi:hypothetical protein